MSKLALQFTRKQINRCLLGQMLTTLLSVCVLYFFYGGLFAGSALLGVLLCLLPQWLFARFWFTYYNANASQQLVKIFYMAELLKLVVISVLFVLFLSFIPLHVLACIVGFMMAQFSCWLAPFFLRNI